jgi:protein-S-isoprenylcysteine O-methyltransferase Ste14
LIVSIGLVALGVYLLKTMGKPDGHFERTTALVTDGIYRFIRHPMYASLFYLTIGACLKHPTLSVIVLGVGAIIAATVTAKIEEKDSIVKFGDEYRDYMKKTKMFAPYIF